GPAAIMIDHAERHAHLQWVSVRRIDLPLAHRSDIGAVRKNDAGAESDVVVRLRARHELRNKGVALVRGVLEVVAGGIKAMLAGNAHATGALQVDPAVVLAAARIDRDEVALRVLGANVRLPRLAAISRAVEPI